jgi:serine/threonine protein kinase
MSPEPARGARVDKRADIWAFGCVLYEMLTGKPPFRGKIASDVLAAVMRDEPDLSQVPAKVRPLLRRCLEKGPMTAGMLLYGERMARLISTTVRLDEEDIRALKRARAAGLSASELIRRGLRVVASRYYSGKRPPSTLLFESTDNKLGDEAELFQGIED